MNTSDIKPSDEDDGMVVDCRHIIIILTIFYIDNGMVVAVKIQKDICILVIGCIGVASIIALTIDYCLSNKWCCTDGQRQEMPPLRDRIISNFSSLIHDLDSETVFPDLLKHDLVTQKEVDEKRNNQPNKKNRFILIKLIENCGELDKKIESILYKQKRILRRPISTRRWPKRDEAKCREKLTSSQKLHQDLLPEVIIDFFFENFIFNLVQYKKCIEKERSRNLMMECFLEETEKTLSKGSFECLLVALQKRESNDEMLVDLKEGLIKGISFKLGKFTDLCHDEGISFKLGKFTDLCHDEVEPNIPTDVHFMISADGHDNLMAIIPANTIHACSEWFIKELAMYPESVTGTHIVLVPLVEKIKDKIKNCIENEHFNNLLEILFCEKEVISSLANDISTVKVTLKWGCPLEGGYSGNLEKLQFPEICKYNQSFLEREMQTETIYEAFKDRDITLCTDDTKNDTATIMRSICENINYHKIFQDILKEDFEFILKRLQHFDPYLLRQNIICNISQLVALDLELDDMQEIFASNNILTKENIKKKCDSLELQKTLVLVKIIQSGTPAMYLYVQLLREREYGTVVDTLMSTEVQDQIKCTDDFDDLKLRPSVLYMKYDVAWISKSANQEIDN